MQSRADLIKELRRDIFRPAAELRSELEKLRRKVRDDEKRRAVYGVVFSVFVLLATPALWVGMSYAEARAFNRLTGKNATTLDAMFVQLRVQ